MEYNVEVFKAELAKEKAKAPVYSRLVEYSHRSEQLGRLIRDKYANAFSVVSCSLENLLAQRTALDLANSGL